ncbi:hypothetical protein Tco_1173098 [Tanacetum coccineum]
MVATQAIKYALKCDDMTVKSVQFQSNNFVGNFSYPKSAPAYKNIFKFFINCFLAEAFMKTPTLLYQNYLREFWCTAVVENPNLPEDDSKPLTLDFKTFCESTWLDYNKGDYDYNKGDYVAHPSPEVVKAELGKIAINEALVLEKWCLRSGNGGDSVVIRGGSGG